MGTPYTRCYEAFMGHLDDYELLYPFDDETPEEFDTRLNYTFMQYFNSAIVKLTNAITSLERDDNKQVTETDMEGNSNVTYGEFLNNLRPIEIEIIGLLMLKEYYRKKLNFLSSLRHSFSDRDWKSHDKSNQMNQYRQMLKEIDNEIDMLSIKNSFIDDKGNAKKDWLGTI